MQLTIGDNILLCYDDYLSCYNTPPVACSLIDINENTKFYDKNKLIIMDECENEYDVLFNTDFKKEMINNNEFAIYIETISGNKFYLLTYSKDIVEFSKTDYDTYQIIDNKIMVVQPDGHR